MIDFEGDSDIRLTFILGWLTRIEPLVRQELRRLENDHPATKQRRDRNKRFELRLLQTLQAIGAVRDYLGQGDYLSAAYHLSVIASNGLMTNFAEIGEPQIFNGSRSLTTADRDRDLALDYRARCEAALAAGEKKPPQKAIAAELGMDESAYSKAIRRGRRMPS